MSRPTPRLALTLAVVGAAIAAPTAGPAAAAPASGAAAHAAACKTVKLGGKPTCLAVGRHCALKYQKTYVKHGLSCARDGKGRLRLVRNSQSF